MCRFCAGTQFLNRGRLLSRMLADITLYITINDKAPPPLACWTCCRRRSGGGGAAKAGASRDQQRGWCGEVQRRGAEGAAVKISKRWHALEDRTGEVGRGKRTAAPPLLLAAAARRSTPPLPSTSARALLPTLLPHSPPSWRHHPTVRPLGISGLPLSAIPPASCPANCCAALRCVTGASMHRWRRWIPGGLVAGVAAVATTTIVCIKSC